MLTLLKQRKISCILKVESLQRGIGKDQEVTEGMTDMADVEKELEEVERKMSELEKERQDRSKRIMDRRVLQVTTLQELGLLEAAGKDSKWRSESDLKDRDQSQESPSPSLIARYSPGPASSRPDSELVLTQVLVARTPAVDSSRTARGIILDPTARVWWPNYRLV